MWVCLRLLCQGTADCRRWSTFRAPEGSAEPRMQLRGLCATLTMVESPSPICCATYAPLSQKNPSQNTCKRGQSDVKYGQFTPYLRLMSDGIA